MHLLHLFLETCPTNNRTWNCAFLLCWHFLLNPFSIHRTCWTCTVMKLSLILIVVRFLKKVQTWGTSFIKSVIQFMSTPLLQVDKSFHFDNQGSHLIFWPALFSKLLFPPRVCRRSCKQEAVWKLTKESSGLDWKHETNQADRNPFAYTSRIACPIQNFPQLTWAIFWTKRWVRHCCNFFSAEATMSFVVAVMSFFRIWHFVFSNMFICVFDVSRARGYIYNLVPRVLRLLYLLVSPFLTSQ